MTMGCLCGFRYRRSWNWKKLAHDPLLLDFDDMGHKEARETNSLDKDSRLAEQLD